jgi:hypothetical protein
MDAKHASVRWFTGADANSCQWAITFRSQEPVKSWMQISEFQMGLRKAVPRRFINLKTRDFSLGMLLIFAIIQWNPAKELHYAYDLIRSARS